MGKLSSVFITAVGVLALSASALPDSPHSHSQDSPKEDRKSAAALAGAYWFDRTGRLPPNRPVTTKPTPKKSFHSPPAYGRSRKQDPLQITLPAGKPH
jgi:hypothetical protein